MQQAINQKKAIHLGLI